MWWQPHQPSCVLGRKNRLFCDCGGHREWLDYAVNLILGLLGLDQKISSRVRPLLNRYKLTLLEQIGPKCFAKVSCTQPTLTRPIPQETLCFPACWHLSHPFHSGWGSSSVVVRHPWVLARVRRVGIQAFPASHILAEALKRKLLSLQDHTLQPLLVSHCKVLLEQWQMSYYTERSKTPGFVTT